MCRQLIRRMFNLTCKKALILLIVGIFVTIFFSYFVFFNNGEPGDIMLNNKRRLDGESKRLYGNKNVKDMDETELEVHEEEKRAIDYWQQFIEKNKFVAIGEVYDNCDEDDRMMVGRTVMLTNNKFFSRVKARTFINVTLESEVTEGKFFIDVQYNGYNIYSRNWDLCDLDANDKDRVVFCPFEPKDYSVVKDRDIPSYLLRGRYQTKAYIVDQNNEIVLCGFSDFQM